MKFSFVIAGLFSAMLVKASFYKVTFEDAAVAQNCVQINSAYLHKVSDDQYVRKNRLYLVNQKPCSAAIELNIKEVCGGVVSSHCSE